MNISSVRVLVCTQQSSRQTVLSINPSTRHLVKDVLSSATKDVRKRNDPKKFGNFLRGSNLLITPRWWRQCNNFLSAFNVPPDWFTSGGIKDEHFNTGTGQGFQILDKQRFVNGVIWIWLKYKLSQLLSWLRDALEVKRKKRKRKGRQAMNQYSENLLVSKS